LDGVDELTAKIVDADSVAELINTITSDGGVLDDRREVFSKLDRLVDNDRRNDADESDEEANNEEVGKSDW